MAPPKKIGPGIGLVGALFTRWTVIAFVGRDSNNASVWRCRCACGTEKQVPQQSLKSGKSPSCGCISRERTTTHGHSVGSVKSRTYSTWRAMLDRCLRPSDIGYSRYGGRGITVCERWLTFENFLADMGERPDRKTIDRSPNNNGNYEPGNCRWATPKEQANNRRQRA